MKTIFETVTGFLLRTGLTWLGRSRLPQIDGTLRVDGVSGPVEIIRDRWGVPHIYAGSVADLFFAQGFVHAQERLWQMELNRRTGTGRLSEIFGAVALDTDRAIRTFGFHRLAQQDWAAASDIVRTTLMAYSNGINAFLTAPNSALPVEFSLLRHRPEPWQPTDSLAFLRLMTWQLSHPWYSKIVRAQLIAAVGAERAAAWDIHYPASRPVTLPDGIETNGVNFSDSLRVADSPFLERGKGSNAWAVAGAKTSTGQPFLCNDIHLGLRAPGLWYQNHLVAEEINVTGISLPCAPFVLAGHNAHIAWGLTIAFTDCEDLFIEKFDPQQPERYLFRDEWLQAEIIDETIEIKGRAEAHQERVTITHHGPIISEVVDTPEQRLALQSMALRTASPIEAWWWLNKAQGWADFRWAMRLIEAPQLNVAYADTEGNIGYWLTGAVPVRAKGEGAVPVPGWTGAYEWIGQVPVEEMPHTLNPKRSYIISCNHRVIDEAYPYFLGNAWMNGYRAQSVTAAFERQATLTPDDFRAMQLDVTCQPGREFAEALASLPRPHPDPDVALALGWLRSWSGQLTADSIAGTLYHVTRYMLVKNLLEPPLGKVLTRRVIGVGFNPVLAASHEFYGYDTVNLLRMLQTPDSWWLEQAGGREAVLTTSLRQAVSWLREKLGPTDRDWQWGKLHRVFFIHSLGVKKPLDRVFNRGPYPIGGDSDTPCQTAMLPDAPYDNRGWGPSMRQIIDLSDLSRSLISVPPGQSGHLASRHYDDRLLPWLRGEYQPMLWTRQQVEAASEGVLTLEREQPG